jgi:homoaconitase/3-isopropylmalate dehydratase large subunit
MTAYNVTIQVPDENELTTIVSAITPDMKLLAMGGVNQTSSAKKQTSSVKKRVKVKRRGFGKDGVTGKDLLISLFKEKATWTTAELAIQFANAGFTSASASARLSELKKSLGIKLVDDHTYSMVKA